MKYMNEAGWDRIGRIALGVVVLGFGWTGAVGGGLGTFLKIVGFLPLATGVMGWCPLYAVFGVRTARAARDVATV